MKLTNQEIQSSIADLPDNIRKAVITFDWGNEILNIANDHGLHMDQIDGFRNETLMIILGKSSSANYVVNLVKELSIKKNTAEEIVEAANIRIFRELQKRAFKTEEAEVVEEKSVYDDYLEPIDHSDLRGPMAEEGVHLVDETFSKPQTGLQNEIESLINVEDPEIDQRSLDSFEMNHQERVVTIEDNNDSRLKDDMVFKDEFNQEIVKETPQVNSYNEPIDDTDLMGIAKHRTDTSILKTKGQVKPDALFNQKPISQSSSAGRDLGQGLNQSLDKHLIDNPFIAKGDSINISPSEQEQIKEDGTFLQSLKKES